MTDLTLVTEKDQQEETRKQEEESWKLTRAEIADRVGQLRRELEAAKERYDGARFDNYTDGIPASLDVVHVNHEPCYAVSYLSPFLERMVDDLQNNIFRKCQSDDVFELYFWSTQTAYEFGMLAGAIYADCSRETIDRFERGLVTALTARHWISKEEERP
jgi:hypothetical protein